jgi:DNA-binding NtrC family response regulator
MAAATLVVNADNSVCEATIDLLRAVGFVAKGPHSAGDFLESNHLGRTSCLIADMQMPGLNGLDLHAHLVRSGKDIRTILTTAFPNDRDRARHRPASSATWPSHQRCRSTRVHPIRSRVSQGGHPVGENDE